MSFRHSSLVWALVAACGVVSFAGSVRAQTITLPFNVERSVGLRDSSQQPNWISYQDCVQGDVMTFNVTVAGNGAQNNLEVWAAGSANCTEKMQRQADNSGCWQVYSKKNESQNQDVAIPVQAIAEQAYGPAPDSSAIGSLESCENGVRLSINLYFMIVNAGDDVQGTAAVWGTTLSTQLPTAPTEVIAGAADGAVSLEWTASMDTGKTGYRFFCQPADSGMMTADGGIGACGSSLSEGAVPPIGTMECGRASATATSGSVSEGLTNGQTYAVGVAAINTVLDVGKLSNVTCVQPMLTEDFFDRYRAAGGQAGGGLCSLSGARSGGGAGGPWAWGLGSLLAFAATGRRRKDRRSRCGAKTR